MAVTKICEVCGSSFSVPPCRAESAKACSKECRLIVAAKSRSRPKIELTCKRCGKAFIERQCHSERRVFCSNECRNADRLENPQPKFGSDNGMWKGGVVDRNDGYAYKNAGKHPFAHNGYVLEHRLVMEEWMREDAPNHKFLVDVDGVKYLDREVEVHHCDEDRKNNARSNLVACTKQAHKDLHYGAPPQTGDVWPDQEQTVEYGESRTEKVCEVCGTMFHVYASLSARGQGRFCSRKCYDAHRNPNGADLPLWVNATCETCGASFSVKRDKVLRGGGKFCSTDCYHASRKKTST